MNAGWAAAAFVLAALGIVVITAGRTGAGVPLLVFAALALAAAFAGDADDR